MSFKSNFSIIRFALLIVGSIVAACWFATEGNLYASFGFLLTYGALYTYGKIKGYIPKG